MWLKGHCWWKTNYHLKRRWCWERMKVGEGDDRGWDGWMASPTQWTRVWVNFGGWWWTERPGVLQSMGLQSRTLLNNWTELWITVWSFLKKLKLELPCNPGIPLLGIYPKKGKALILKTYAYVHCSIIYNSQDMEVTYVSIDRWKAINKKWCVCVCMYVYIYGL